MTLVTLLCFTYNFCNRRLKSSQWHIRVVCSSLYQYSNFQLLIEFPLQKTFTGPCMGLVHSNDEIVLVRIRVKRVHCKANHSFHSYTYLNRIYITISRYINII